MSNGEVVKTLNIDSHVAVVRNINNVVENNLANTRKMRVFFVKINIFNKNTC